jgi:hypothetical protein
MAFVALTVALVAVASAPVAEFAMAGSVTAAPANGSEFVNGIRVQDEIVLVDVRPLGGRCAPEQMAAKLHIESYAAVDDGGDRRWQHSDAESLRAADPTVSTLIFVHGNKITPWDAKHEGLNVYRRIVRQSTSSKPIRYVIFSWPSSQIRGPLNDVRVKAMRTRPAGCQLAWVVDQLPADTPVTLVGFSFGARIITGALHVLGGGSLGGLGLAELQHPHRAPMNAVLFAAALHSNWLCPGRYHGLAMSQVDQMLLLNNTQDRAMRYYHFCATSGRPQALGLCGPTCIDAAGAAKLTQRNLAGYVGANHNLFCYLSAPGVTSELWDYASGEGGN